MTSAKKSGAGGQAETPRSPESPRAKNISAACRFDGCDRTFKTDRGARQHERSCPHRPAPAGDAPETITIRFQCADCGGFPGPVETKTRVDVAALGDSHPMGEALGEMAFALARRLDASRNLEAAESRAIGAITKELRACLVEISRLVEPDDDGLEDELSTPTGAT